MKESQRERAEEKLTNDTQNENALSLSSSPSWDVFCLFFKEESKRLSDFQRKTICDIPDSALLKQAIEHLLGNGYTGAWNKISLIKKVMQELAAAASVPASAGAGGAASPALLTLTAKPAVTVKSLERRANLGKIAELRSSAADVIDVESRTFNVLGA